MELVDGLLCLHPRHSQSVGTFLLFSSYGGHLGFGFVSRLAYCSYLSRCPNGLPEPEALQERRYCFLISAETPLAMADASRHGHTLAMCVLAIPLYLPSSVECGTVQRHCILESCRIKQKSEAQNSVGFLIG